MLESLRAVLCLLLATLGVAAVLDAGSLGATGAVAVTVAAVLATVALIAVVAMSRRPADDRSRPHPHRAIRASTLLAQSDPDAPGRPRPRAPQSVAPAT